MNSIMERWLQTCRRELLDRTLIWNKSHLLHTLREFEQFYNGRPGAHDRGFPRACLDESRAVPAAADRAVRPGAVRLTIFSNRRGCSAGEPGVHGGNPGSGCGGRAGVRLVRSSVIVLVVLCLAPLLEYIDMTVVNVALPAHQGRSGLRAA
jgi:hypothetical protein